MPEFTYRNFRTTHDPTFQLLCNLLQHPGPRVSTISQVGAVILLNAAPIIREVYLASDETVAFASYPSPFPFRSAPSCSWYA